MFEFHPHHFTFVYYLGVWCPCYMRVWSAICFQYTFILHCVQLPLKVKRLNYLHKLCQNYLLNSHVQLPSFKLGSRWRSPISFIFHIFHSLDIHIILAMCWMSNLKIWCLLPAFLVSFFSGAAVAPGRYALVGSALSTSPLGLATNSAHWCTKW